MHNAFRLKNTLEKAPQHLPVGCYKCSQARPGSVKLPLGGVPVARILLLHTEKQDANLQPYHQRSGRPWNPPGGLTRVYIYIYMYKYFGTIFSNALMCFSYVLLFSASFG